MGIGHGVLASHFGLRRRHLSLGFYSRPGPGIILIHGFSLDTTHAQAWTALPRGPTIHRTLLTHTIKRIK